MYVYTLKQVPTTGGQKNPEWINFKWNSKPEKCKSSTHAIKTKNLVILSSRAGLFTMGWLNNPFGALRASNDKFELFLHKINDGHCN